MPCRLTRPFHVLQSHVGHFQLIVFENVRLLDLCKTRMLHFLMRHSVQTV